MKWNALTLVILITTSFAIGEDTATNTDNGDQHESNNDFLANFIEIEKTLHTCAIPSENMFIRPVNNGQPAGSEFDKFCYYEARDRPLALYLCQYYKFLVETYFGQYCNDPNRQPMDTATQYQIMRGTPFAPCKKLVDTVMQQVSGGFNKPVFSSTDECETLCHQSLFCTNLAYLLSIFQTGNVSGEGGETVSGTGGSPSGDGEVNAEGPEGGKESGVDGPPKTDVLGGGEGEGGKNSQGEVASEQKSDDQLGDDDNNDGDDGDEGDNDGTKAKDGHMYDNLHISVDNPSPMENQGDDGNGIPPPAELSSEQKEVPGDTEEPPPFDDNEKNGKPAEGNQENGGTEETVETEGKEGEGGSNFHSTASVGKSATPAGNFSDFDFGNKDGQMTFDNEESVSSDSETGDLNLVDEPSDGKTSKLDYFEEDELQPPVGLDKQDKGDGNEQLPNNNNQQVASKNQNSFKEEMSLLEEEEASSHFLAYSLTAIILIMVTYILYHNKQKIVAIIIEGRNAPNGKRRRYNQNVYTTVNETA